MGDGGVSSRDESQAGVVARRRLLAPAAVAAGSAAFLLGEETAGATVVEDDLVALAESVRAGATMVGGGAIAASELLGTAPNQYVELSWSTPFTVGFAVSANFSSDGSFSIAQPAASTVITGVNRADVTVAAGGVPLGPHDALYYVLPVGSGSSSVAANFRVVQPVLGPSPTSYDTPAEWVLVAANIPGTGSVRLGTGVVLEPGGQWNEAWGSIGTGSPELAHHHASLPISMFGAVSGRGISDAAMSSGSAQLTSASAAFTAADVGSLVAVRGAGAGGTDLWSTVASVVSTTTVSLAGSAATSVSNAETYLGPDCCNAIAAAVSAASALGGGTVAVPPGIYMLSKCVNCSGVANVRISGAATIRYGSASASADGLPNQHARSAFLFHDARNVTIADLRFVGDYASTELGVNSGSVAYGKVLNTESKSVDFLTLENVQSWYGFSLLQHDERLNGPPAGAAARGARLVNCVSWGARGYVSLPSHSVVTGCHFELPVDDATYKAEYNPSRGSTHCVYLAAGRESVVVNGNTFRYLRRWALKASGSTFPVRGVTFTNNDVWDCGGGAQFGADDDQLHANFVCTNNSFYNTATRDTGWSEQVTVNVLGCKNAVIANNTFLFEGPVVSPASRSIISITYNGPAAAPTEQVLIEGNLLQGLVTSETAANPSFNKGIFLSRVGEYSTDPSGGGTTGDPGPTALCVRVAGNQIKGCAAVGIFAERTLNPIIEQNQVANVTTFAHIEGCAFPVVRHNVLLPGAIHSTNAQIRMRDCSWPIVYDNHSGGIRPIFATPPAPAYTSRSRHISTSDNKLGQPPVEFPLLGRKGKATPTEGQSEVVFAYGAPSSWTTNDTVAVAGTTFTFVTSAPGANQFNNLDGLVALINGLPNTTAADYGDPWSVTTRHIRVRRSTTAPWRLDITCAAATAGRTLSNDNVDGYNPRTNGVGGAAGATVIWSPMAEMLSVPTLVATNSEARSLLTNGYMVEDRTLGMDGSYALVVHDTPAGDESFRWSLH